MAKINAIYAVGRNGEMGNADGSLPWRTTASDGKQIVREDLPQEVIEEAKRDMENFKRITIGNIIIMGYNTYRTFPVPLSNRVNIVIDRTCDTDIIPNDGKTPQSNNWFFVPTLESAITLAEKIATESQSQKSDNSQTEKNTSTGENETSQKEIFIIGGAKILREAFEKNLIEKSNGKIYKTIINADFPNATVRFPF